MDPTHTDSWGLATKLLHFLIPSNNPLTRTKWEVNSKQPYSESQTSIRMLFNQIQVPGETHKILIKKKYSNKYPVGLSIPLLSQRMVSFIHGD